MSILLENQTATSAQSTAERDVIESTEYDVEEGAQDLDAYPSQVGYGGATVDGFSPLGLPTPPHSSKAADAAVPAFSNRTKSWYSQNKDLSDPSPIFPDVIDRGILSAVKATELHDKFLNELQSMYV